MGPAEGAADQIGQRHECLCKDTCSKKKAAYIFSWSRREIKPRHTPDEEDKYRMEPEWNRSGGEGRREDEEEKSCGRVNILWVLICRQGTCCVHLLRPERG